MKFDLVQSAIKINSGTVPSESRLALVWLLLWLKQNTAIVNQGVHTKKKKK